MIPHPPFGSNGPVVDDDATELLVWLGDPDTTDALTDSDELVELEEPAIDDVCPVLDTADELEDVADEEETVDVCVALDDSLETKRLGEVGL